MTYISNLSLNIHILLNPTISLSLLYLYVTLINVQSMIIDFEINMGDIVQGNRIVSKKPLPELPEIWHGKPFVEIVFNLTQEALDKNPDREWMRNGQTGEFLLLKDMMPKCMKTASVLTSKGLKEGDVVHVVMTNSVEFHTTVFAIWMLGATASLADPSLRTSVLLEQIKETRSSIIICRSDHGLNKSNVSDQIVTIENLFRDESLLSSIPDFSDARKAIDQTLVIFWSSGTTGRPKGIAHGINFFLRSLVKSAFPPATLLQTVSSIEETYRLLIQGINV
jgi:non-ribosomal peptide synthetase component F